METQDNSANNRKLHDDVASLLFSPVDSGGSERELNEWRDIVIYLKDWINNSDHAAYMKKSSFNAPLEELLANSKTPTKYDQLLFYAKETANLVEIYN